MVWFLRGSAGSQASARFWVGVFHPHPRFHTFVAPPWRTFWEVPKSVPLSSAPLVAAPCPAVACISKMDSGPFLPAPFNPSFQISTNLVDKEYSPEDITWLHKATTLLQFCLYK